MITIKDILGIIVILLMLTIYAIFKDNPRKGLTDAGKMVDKIFGGIKKLIREIERI